MSNEQVKNEVVKKAKSEVAVLDIESFGDQGFENLTSKDLALPFLKILGQLSPEVNKRDGKYVQGAERTGLRIPNKIGPIVSALLRRCTNFTEVFPASSDGKIKTFAPPLPAKELNG